MFTGLIEDVGVIADLEKSGEGGVITVSTSLPTDEIRLGDSVAVNGICLTVTSLAGNLLRFDLSPETFSTGTFAARRRGDSVNLERALRVGDRLGGHLVTGHVDTTAQVVTVRQASGNTVFTFRLEDPAMARYVVAKGSVTIDGVSLTVNTVAGADFTLNVIPHTATMTTLRLLRSGDRVNVETDILGKYVEKLLGTRNQAGQGLSLERLAENGFL